MVNRRSLPARYSGALGRMLLELAIVFMGVSAAFVADNYRQRQEDDRRARQVAAALRSDLDAYVVTTRELVDEMGTGLSAWADANRRGEMAAPFYYRISGAERPPIGVWHAALQSQAADLLPPSLLFDLAFFYSEINGIADRYVRYNTFTEVEVLPRLGAGFEAFYQTSGTLSPVFREHMSRLEEIRGWMEESIAWASRLSSELAAVADDER